MMTKDKLSLVLTTISLFGATLPGSVSAADALANDRQWSMEPAWVQELTIESDFTVFMEPHVSAETQRLALRKLWRLLEWEGDGLNCYESDYGAIETVRQAKIAEGTVSAMRWTHR
jgi:hypothetical protein